MRPTSLNYRPDRSARVFSATMYSIHSTLDRSASWDFYGAQKDRNVFIEGDTSYSNLASSAAGTSLPALPTPVAAESFGCHTYDPAPQISSQSHLGLDLFPLEQVVHGASTA